MLEVIIPIHYDLIAKTYDELPHIIFEYELVKKGELSLIRFHQKDLYNYTTLIYFAGMNALKNKFESSIDTKTPNKNEL